MSGYTAPAFETTHGLISNVLSQVGTGLRSAKYQIRDAIDQSNVADPIPAQNITFQYAVNVGGTVRDFELTVSLTETTGNTAPAPAPVETISAA